MTLGRTKSAKAFDPRCPPTHQTLRAQLLHIAPGNVLGAEHASNVSAMFPIQMNPVVCFIFSTNFRLQNRIFVCQLVLPSNRFLDERLNFCKAKHLSVWLWLVWETLLTTNYQTMSSFQQHTHRTCMVM